MTKSRPTHTPTIETDPSIAELAAIGFALMFPKAFNQLAGVRSHHFSDELRAQVWEVLSGLVDIHGMGINPVLLAGEITKRALMKASDTMDFLVECQDHARNAAEPEAAGVTFASMIIDGGMRRRMRQAAGKIEELSKSPISTDEMRMDMQAEVMELLQYETSSAQQSLEQILEEELKRVGEPLVQGPPGLMTGIRKFDEIYSGFEPGDLVIFGARPSVGKTSLATQLAVEWSTKQRVPGGVWSLEMTTKKLLPRLACQISGLDGHRVKQNSLNAAEMDEHKAALVGIHKAVKDKMLTICDTRRIDGRNVPKSITDIVAEVRHWKNRIGMKWIVVDYMQRIAGVRRKGESREREVASVSSMLKQLAVEAELVVVAVSAVGRPHKDHMKRRPTMYELRESGQLEFDADYIVMLHNHHLVHQDQDKPMTRLPRENAELIMAKNRNGPTGTAGVQFVPSCGRFEEYMIGTGLDNDYNFQGD